MAVSRGPRRRVKVRGGSLGWFLCWAVVFADIGTSIYYVPGILYPSFGSRSAIFVCMTLVVFLLLVVKYAEVAWRFPEGGGVVNVASRALHPFVGLVGGLFILIDYYLTAAISAVSGLIYLSVVAPGLRPVVVPVTALALVVLGGLNALGIKESARVSAAFVVLAALGQLLVVLFTAISLGPSGIAASVRAVGHGTPLTPLVVLTGYGAAFLAFSGLETIAQLAPSMREPRRRIAGQAMVAVALTMTVTSPLLTLWATTQLDGSKVDPSQFISILGAHVSGPALADYVAVSGALLLVFASNTAIIGAYHVFVALCRMGFLPRVLEQRNRWRHTPHWAILLAIVLPVALVILSRGDVVQLGDLYAFGLLGAFILTCAALDVLRWQEGWWGRGAGAQPVMFVVGVVTTVLVAVAWLINLVAKPLATEFGGGLLLIGLVIGLFTYNYLRSRQPVVFPVRHGPSPAVVPVGGRRLPACPVLAILPHKPEVAEAVVTAAVRTAGGRPLTFVYRGDPLPPGQFMEVDDPYLRDRRAQVAFSRAERMARKTVPDRRYVYIPGSLRREAIADVWREVHPRETVVADGDQDVLPAIAVDRVRRTYVDGLPVLELVTATPRTAA